MAKQNDGGPAFPRPGFIDPSCGTLPEGDNFSHGQDGLSLRDYFAAHAPERPQWNFEVKMKSPRPQPLPMQQGDEIPPNWREMNAWDAEYAKQARLQWPWVYADATLSARQ